jgi:hypothetical protein
MMRLPEAPQLVELALLGEEVFERRALELLAAGEAHVVRFIALEGVSAHR